MEDEVAIERYLGPSTLAKIQAEAVSKSKWDEDEDDYEDEYEAEEEVGYSPKKFNAEYEDAEEEETEFEDEAVIKEELVAETDEEAE
jgi:hypothetical protein